MGEMRAQRQVFPAQQGLGTDDAVVGKPDDWLMSGEGYRSSATRIEVDSGAGSLNWSRSGPPIGQDGLHHIAHRLSISS